MGLTDRASLARLPAVVVFLLKQGLHVNMWSQVLRHESSPCVLLGLNAAPPSVASILPSGCVVQCLPGPIECCRRQYHFRPLAVVQEPTEHEGEAAGAAAAAAAVGDAAGENPDNDNNVINWEQRLAGKDSAAVYKCMQWDPEFET